MQHRPCRNDDTDFQSSHRLSTPNEVISRDAMARVNCYHCPSIVTMKKRKREAETSSWHGMAVNIAKIMKDEAKDTCSSL